MHDHEYSTNNKRFWTTHRLYSIILLCFAVFMVVFVISMGIEEGYDTGIMSGSFVPTVFSIILGIFALIQILQPNHKTQISVDDSVDTNELPTTTQVKRAILIFILILAYVYGLGIIGFMGATIPFAGAILWITGNRFKIQWAVAIAFVPLLWVLAEYLLEIPLP